MQPIAACDTLMRDYDARMIDAATASQAADPPAPELRARAELLSKEHDSTVTGCFAGHVKGEAWFATAAAQAQTLADGLAGR